MPTPEPATPFGWASLSHCPAWPTPASSTPSPHEPANTSTQHSSSRETAPSTYSPPAPEQVPRGHWSPHSSKTSSRPPADSLPNPPAHASTHRSCWHSTRSATYRHSPHCPCSWPKEAAPESPRCPSFSPCPRYETNGATTPPAQSGTHPSSISTSEALHKHATSKTSPHHSAHATRKIGRASCRERVCQ